MNTTRKILFAAVSMAVLWGQVKVLGETLSKDNNPILVFRFNNVEVERIAPVSSTNSAELPRSLIIEPGVYTFLGQNYALEKEGLYRLFRVPHDPGQRIVYKNDHDALLSAICWIVTHGDTDNGKSNADLTTQAAWTKLLLTCGDVCRWAKDLLGSVGLKSRIVLGQTIDARNTYDNGHVCLEVWREKWKKWVLYDLDGNCRFVDKRTGTPLSMIEFSRRVADADYLIVPLSLDIPVHMSNTSYTDSTVWFLSEAMLLNREDWYKRVMQIPLIYDGSERTWLFCDETYKDRVESFFQPSKCVDESVFMKEFYGEE